MPTLYNDHTPYWTDTPRTPGMCCRVATLENALAWADTTDQFAYCVDLLEISAWDDDAERLVLRLEQLMARVIMTQGTI